MASNPLLNSQAFLPCICIIVLQISLSNMSTLVSCKFAAQSPLEVPSFPQPAMVPIWLLYLTGKSLLGRQMGLIFSVK